EAVVPFVARMARPHRVAGLVGDERSFQQLVEWEGRSGRDDLADVGMVEHEQVVALCEHGDRGVGGLLERTRRPGGADPGLLLEAVGGREERVPPALVIPGDASERDGRGHALVARAHWGTAMPRRAARFRCALAVYTV